MVIKWLTDKEVDDVLAQEYDELSLGEMEAILIEMFGVSAESIDLVVKINGLNEETMTDILYAVSGYRYFDQIEK